MKLKIAIYARLSKDDGSRYSSIESQIQLAKEYIKEYIKKLGLLDNEYEIIIYIDDNVSGFIDLEDRPQFNKMLEDIRKGKINIVVAKDLSRVGRKNYLTQMILDEWKKHKINLILLQEMGRLFNLLEDDDELIGLSGWWNERYIKDLSRKVKSGMGTRLKNGLLIQGPKYGYIKKPGGKLIGNEEVREAIETIFNLYESGLGMRRICDILNAEYHFLTPSEMIEKTINEREAEKDEELRKPYKRKVKRLWDMYMISRILQDDLYIGTLRTHKKELPEIKGKAVKVPLEEQNVFLNHHEPIISEEQFYKVQEIIEKRHKQTATYKRGKNEYIFGGFIRCGECGYGGTGIVRTRSKRPGYIAKKSYECSMYRKYGVSRCCSHNIKEEYILSNFKILLENLKKEYIGILKDMSLNTIKQKSKNNVEKLERELEKLKMEYKMIAEEKIKQLASNIDGKEIIEETFEVIEKEKLSKIQGIKVTLDRINSEDAERKKQKVKNAIDYFDEIINAERPSKELLNNVLEEIKIYHDKTVKFELKMEIDKLI